jgi:hypothetical protein
MAHPSHDRLLAGPHCASLSMQHNDHRHVLIIKDRIVPLTRTEYTITMLLLHNVEVIQISSAQAGRMNFFVPIGELLQVAQLSREILRQHIRNANVKLAPHGVVLAAVGGYGYTVVFLGKLTQSAIGDHVLAISS